MFDTREHQGFGIAVKNVGFSYGNKRVLEGVTFQIPKGEVWALVGRSGCGKTTLLHVIAGLFRPSAGQTRVAMRDSLVLGRIRGVVFQDESLLGWLSVEDNVLFPRHRVASAELRQAATDMLTAVGLADYRSWYPSELSTGMRKRLEFARALVADQEYILADEPFGTVDALTRRDLWRLWKDVRGRAPRTGLFATHDPEEAVRLCDAVITLERGNPGRVSGIIQIPARIRELGACEDEPNLVAFKEKIIQSLGE